MNKRQRKKRLRDYCPRCGLMAMVVRWTQPNGRTWKSVAALCECGWANPDIYKTEEIFNG